MFVPWTFDVPPDPGNVWWDAWLDDCLVMIPLRIFRTINHLDLLHKSRIEVKLHQMQLRSQHQNLEHQDMEFGYNDLEAKFPVGNIEDTWETTIELAHSRDDDWAVGSH
jgi:hypothetical protein